MNKGSRELAALSASRTTGRSVYAGLASREQRSYSVIAMFLVPFWYFLSLIGKVFAGKLVMNDIMVDIILVLTASGLTFVGVVHPSMTGSAGVAMVGTVTTVIAVLIAWCFRAVSGFDGGGLRVKWVKSWWVAFPFFLSGLSLLVGYDGLSRVSADIGVGAVSLLEVTHHLCGTSRSVAFYARWLGLECVVCAVTFWYGYVPGVMWTGFVLRFLVEVPVRVVSDPEVCSGSGEFGSWRVSARWFPGDDFNTARDVDFSEFRFERLSRDWDVMRGYWGYDVGSQGKELAVNKDFSTGDAEEERVRQAAIKFSYGLAVADGVLEEFSSRRFVNKRTMMLMSGVTVPLGMDWTRYKRFMRLPVSVPWALRCFYLLFGIDVLTEVQLREVRRLAQVGDAVLGMAVVLHAMEEGADVGETSDVKQRLVTNAAFTRFFSQQALIAGSTYVSFDLLRRSEKTIGTRVEAAVGLWYLTEGEELWAPRLWQWLLELDETFPGACSIDSD